MDEYRTNPIDTPITIIFSSFWYTAHTCCTCNIIFTSSINLLGITTFPVLLHTHLSRTHSNPSPLERTRTNGGSSLPTKLSNAVLALVTDEPALPTAVNGGEGGIDVLGCMLLLHVVVFSYHGPCIPLQTEQHRY